MNANESYIILYIDGNWRGPQLQINLRDGGTVDIDHNTPWNDGASSFELYAPSNVKVRICQHNTYRDNWPGSNHYLTGNGATWGINKSELKVYGLHDEISSLVWYIDEVQVDGSQTVGSDLDI